MVGYKLVFWNVDIMRYYTLIFFFFTFECRWISLHNKYAYAGMEITAIIQRD